MKVEKKVISFYLIEKYFNNNSLKNMKAKILFFVSLFFILNLSFTVEHCEAQWQQCDGIYGGYILSLAISGNNIFAGSDYNGLFLSTNNGKSWTQTALKDKKVYSLAISGNNIFAGCEYNQGVYLSTNNGNSWTQTGLNVHDVYSLAISGNNIVAGCSNNQGVYLSTNNGQNWTQTGLNNKSVNSVAISGNNIFAGTENNGVYYSTNNGQSWTQSSLNVHDVYSLAISGTNIFAGCSNNQGVYLSTNNGQTWTQTGLNNQSVRSLVISGNNIFAGTYANGVYLSTNGGTSWTQTGLNNNSVYSFAISENNPEISGQVIFAGTYGNGVYLSTNNGTSWTQTALNDKIVLSLSISGNNIFAGTHNYSFSGGVYLSTNNGTSWTQTPLNNQEVYSLAISGNNIFAGTHNISFSGGVYLSTNNGTTWTQTALDKDVNCLSISGNNIFAGTYKYGVYLSTNNGTTWTQTALNYENDVYSFAISGNNIFAGISNYHSTSGVYLSTNNGASWTQTALNKDVKALAISGNNIFAGTYGRGVSLSTNNGTTWTQTVLTNQYVNSLAISGNNIFTGTNSGVYLSTDNGQSWIQKNQGWNGVTAVSALLIANNYIFAGTYGQSVWRRPLSEIVADSIHTVAGTVKYSDNNQPVSGGYVKALKLNYSTMQMETIDSTGIQSNGTYILPNVRTDSVYIRPYPNSTTVVDFIPTYYPSSITWENATVLYVTSNLNNINVGVIRANIATSSSTITGSVFKTTYNPLPGLKDVLLYAKLNNEIRGFSFSDMNGNYMLNNMPAGNYKVYANRPGYKSDSIAVNMPSGGTLNNINFTLYPFWTSIKKLESGIITEYKLEQNYPNPFNSKTKIKFEVKKSGNVKLKVFDITGKLVADIVDSELETGRYEVLFDAKNLSSSIYFYRLTTGDFTETKRMILIK
jgi:hypothetical protein